MFYKIAKALSKVTIAFGFVCMAGGCSVEQQELFAPDISESSRDRQPDSRTDVCTGRSGSCTRSRNYSGRWKSN